MSHSSSNNALRIAFYAPLKSPYHPTPSGDRKIAQLFKSALQQAGFEVVLASQLRSFDKTGNSHRQQRMLAIAKREVARILRRWKKEDFRPDAWFSYHLYYKAPDLIGPLICAQLNIPYLVAEASWAIKRANGPWALYHQQLDVALHNAAKVICINPVDKLAITDYYAEQAALKIVSMKAFIDQPTRFALKQSTAGPIHTDLTREQVAALYHLDTNKPWLIAIAMMRQGDKFSSYQKLSEVIHNLYSDQQLLIVGDGQMRTEVEQLFKDIPNITFCGALQTPALTCLLSHCEILVWPAINEALGMVFLEAQQLGVAVVAGDQGGVSSIVKHGVTGLLSDAYEPAVMAANIDKLLAEPEQLKRMQQSAARYIQEQHSIPASAKQLATIIQQAITQQAVEKQPPSVTH